MKNRITLYCAVILSISMLTLWGCPKSTQMSSSPEAQNGTAVTPSAPQAASGATAGSEARQNEQTASGAQGLEPIHFDYNQSVIRADAAAVMKADAQWLKAHPGVKIRIEGNCDERGTKEYNLALGERHEVSCEYGHFFQADIPYQLWQGETGLYGRERSMLAEKQKR